MRTERVTQFMLAVMSLVSMPALAGVFGGALDFDTGGGVRISCANPQRVLGVVRTADAITVFQAGPAGVRWKVGLPPLAAERIDVNFAPDGSAAVVSQSIRGATPRGFLVTGRGEPIRIDGGVGIVDFQGRNALVATQVPAGNETPTGTRVRVYDLHSGELLGDSSFQDELWSTHDSYQQFMLRLAEDGRAYYYIRSTRSAGDELVVRDVESGALLAVHDNHPAIPTLVGNAIPHVGIHDALLYADRGYMVAGGKLYAIEGNGLVAIETPEALGWPSSLVESADAARQVVVGDRGWGVLDARSGRWLLVEPGGYATVLPGEREVTVVDMSLHAPGIRTYDVSAPQPGMTRSRAGPIDREAFLCANAFGYLSRGDGGFQWHRTVAHP
jgi:hypothetical protein